MSRKQITKLYMTDTQFDSYISKMSEEEKFNFNTQMMDNYAKKYIKPMLNNTYYANIKQEILKELYKELFNTRSYGGYGNNSLSIEGLNSKYKQELLNTFKEDFNKSLNEFKSKEDRKNMEEHIAMEYKKLEEKNRVEYIKLETKTNTLYQHYDKTIEDTFIGLKNRIQKLINDTIEQASTNIKAAIKKTFLESFGIDNK